jgi:20S proteasome subunit beta 1
LQSRILHNNNRIESNRIELRSLDTGRQPTVKVAAHLMRRLIYNNKDRLMAGVIVAGWDPVDGGSVYTITLGGSCLRLPFATGGSGSVFIAGLLDSEFRTGMTKDAARALAKKACSHAMARDGSSGGVIRTVAIDESGVDRDYTPGNDLPFGPCPKFE